MLDAFTVPPLCVLLNYWSFLPAFIFSTLKLINKPNLLSSALKYLTNGASYILCIDSKSFNSTLTNLNSTGDYLLSCIF